MVGHQFNSFWNGNSLPPLAWVCLKSFVEHGHRINLFSYERIDVPSGVRLLDATKIFDRERLFFFQNSVAAFTDLFRYELILRTGDWWVDADVLCVGSDIPECDWAWAWQDAATINGAVLKFPRQYPLFEELLKKAAAASANMSEWPEIGPHMLTAVIPGLDCENQFGTREGFYPIHWLETFLFWLPHQEHLILAKSKQAHFIHLWYSMFERMGIDLSFAPPQNSFLATLYSRDERKLPLKPLTQSDLVTTIRNIRSYLRRDWVPEICVRDLERTGLEDYFDGGRGALLV